MSVSGIGGAVTVTDHSTDVAATDAANAGQTTTNSASAQSGQQAGATSTPAASGSGGLPAQPALPDATNTAAVDHLTKALQAKIDPTNGGVLPGVEVKNEGGDTPSDTLAKSDMKTALGLIDFRKPGGDVLEKRIVDFINGVDNFDEANVKILNNLLNDAVNTIGRDTIVDTDGTTKSLPANPLTSDQILAKVSSDQLIWDAALKCPDVGGPKISRSDVLGLVSEHLSDIDWSKPGASRAHEELVHRLSTDQFDEVGRDTSFLTNLGNDLKGMRLEFGANSQSAAFSGGTSSAGAQAVLEAAKHAKSVGAQITQQEVDSLMQTHLSKIDWSAPNAKEIQSELTYRLSTDQFDDVGRDHSFIVNLENDLKAIELDQQQARVAAAQTQSTGGAGGAAATGAATSGGSQELDQVQQDVVELAKVVTSVAQPLTADDISTLQSLKSSLSDPSAAPLKVSAKTAPGIKAAAELLLKDILAAGQTHKLTSQDLTFVQSFDSGLNELISAFNSGSYAQSFDTQSASTKPTPKKTTATTPNA